MRWWSEPGAPSAQNRVRIAARFATLGVEGILVASQANARIINLALWSECAVLSVHVHANLCGLEQPDWALCMRSVRPLAGAVQVPLSTSCPLPEWRSRTAVHSSARDFKAAEECDKDKDFPANMRGPVTLWFCSQLSAAGRMHCSCVSR